MSGVGQMRFSALFFSPILLALALLLAPPVLASPPTCFPLDDLEMRTARDVCIAAHVYNVVTVENGTHFLDLCRPETADAQCRFSIVSYNADHGSVGNLEQLRGKDVEIRGAIQRYGSRYLMILNDEGQLHHQAPHFRPDPRLLSAFSAEEGAPADAPELRVNFHHHGKKLEHE